MAKSQSRAPRIDRRTLLKGAALTAATTVAAEALQACAPSSTPSGDATPAPNAPTAGRGVPGAAPAASPASSAKTLTLFHESCFVKQFDDFFQQTLAPEYQRETGSAVSYDLADASLAQSKAVGSVDASSGPDATLLQLNWARLYDQKLVDLTNIANDLGNRYGGWVDVVKEACVVNGAWKALPIGNVGQLMVYRTDWFKEAGYERFPETWDELLEAGTKLKARGRPFGFGYGHGGVDSHGWMYPLLWSYGGREVDRDGKTVTLDSNETARAVDFARKFFEQCNPPDVLGWNEASNDRAFLGQRISATNDRPDILIAAKGDAPRVADVVGHALNPRSASGEIFQLLNPWSHAAYTFGHDVSATRTFLAWLHDEKQLSPWLASSEAYFAPFLHRFDNHPMWSKDPRMQPYRDSVQYSHLPGWPGPSGWPSSESLARYVIVDMFAGAAQGKTTKEVIASATAQLKEIYSKGR